jgi:hypothetical protein
MSTDIEAYLKKGDIKNAISNSYIYPCLRTILCKNYNLTDVNLTDVNLTDVNLTDINLINNHKSHIRIKLLCSWTDSKRLSNTWSKMNNNKGIHLVNDKPIDYYVIINSTNEYYDPTKTFLFQMEPNMKYNNIWGKWCEPDKKDFLKIFSHNQAFNNIEWHLSKNYEELSNQTIIKTRNLSTVLSSKYVDPGQIKRIDFVKFCEKKIHIDVYGDNKFNYKNYKKSLPYHSKDEALFGYRYHFNAENNDIYNYFTEKIIDGILAECLVFYWGCPNISEYIDERAFIKLDLNDFENDLAIIEKAIEEDWYSQRLPYIKAAKKRILDELQFFPRLLGEIKKI